MVAVFLELAFVRTVLLIIGSDAPPINTIMIFYFKRLCPLTFRISCFGGGQVVLILIASLYSRYRVEAKAPCEFGLFVRKVGRQYSLTISKSNTDPNPKTKLCRPFVCRPVDVSPHTVTNVDSSVCIFLIVLSGKMEIEHNKAHTLLQRCI